MAGLFGLDCQTNHTMTLLQELGGANSPVLFSPLYLTVTVLTAYTYAKGTTLMETIPFVLCIPGDQKISSYNSNQGTFVNSFANVDKEYVTSDYEFFAQKPEKSLIVLTSSLMKQFSQSINKVIAKMTNQSITQLPTKRFLRFEFRSVNVGEITLEQKWKMKFNAPKNGTFYVNATSKRTIPMMQQTSAEFGYLETKHFRALRLPFVLNSTLAKNCTMDTNRTKRKQKCLKDGQDNLYLLVFLPQKRFGLPETLEYLRSSTIRKLVKTKNSTIDLTLPSFDLEYATTFDHQLEQFGVKKLLDPKEADIPAMFSKRVYHGGFTQKIRFKVLLSFLSLVSMLSL
ncbi:Serine protease inhibitor 3/4 isoform X9 [Aphelenchoides besseyi]|nr:Serine protease inhibitor 3/4 isoform X9 [Aphelenchoides besseyi]